MLQKLKKRILVHHERLILLRVFREWNTQVCLDIPLRYVVDVSACIIRIYTVFCTKTCLVPFVKPFHWFKLLYVFLAFSFHLSMWSKHCYLSNSWYRYLLILISQISVLWTCFHELSWYCSLCIECLINLTAVINHHTVYCWRNMLKK